ncbi:MAG: ELM1/GtrOC1 family putative glycosyltransferase, partial [Acidobacteriota bacterium]
MRIWALLSYRAGMNSQILGLAEALDRPFERRRLAYRPGWAGWWPAYLRRTTLAGLDLERSDLLAPPWPDLVLTAGRRHEPVCRWLRIRSGGTSRSVFVGRTWAGSRHFDLVVTTPQYRVRPAANVLENPTTLHRVTPSRLRGAAERWGPRLGGLPRPRVAVLAGGTSGPFPFGPVAAARLGREATAAAGEGTLMVTTSSRTSAAAAE